MGNNKLKFRAWNGEEMISPDYITREGIAYWKENSIITSTELIMLYSGVRDFYQGDIIQYPNKDIIGVVKFGFYEYSNGADVYIYGNGFYIENLHGDFIEPLFKDGFDRCSVIGNIYHNG